MMTSSSNYDQNSPRRGILKKNHDVTIMTSSGHVTSSVTCPIDSACPLSYRLSIGTIPLSGFVFEIFSAKVATTIITWWRHQWRHKARMNPWKFHANWSSCFLVLLLTKKLASRGLPKLTQKAICVKVYRRTDGQTDGWTTDATRLYKLIGIS